MFVYITAFKMYNLSSVVSLVETSKNCKKYTSTFESQALIVRPTYNE